MTVSRFAYWILPLSMLASASAQSGPNPLDRGLAPAQAQPVSGSPLAVVTGYTDRNTWAANAGGSPTLVDFDSLPDETLITGTGALTPWGIADTFGSSVPGGGPVSQYAYCSCSMNFPMFIAGTLPSEPNYFANDRQPPAFATGRLTFVFSSPTTACGAFVADQSPIAGFSIEVFDGGGASLGAISVAPRTLPDSFVGIVSSIPFASAEFRADDGFDSWGLDNVEHVGDVGGTTICFGDGSGAPCGCGNEVPGTDGGCRNSLNVTGLLTSSGSPDTTNDTFSLSCSGVRAQPGLFFQGDNTIGGGAGSSFGDGVRCCGSNVVRIQIVVPSLPEPSTAQMTEAATTNGPPGTIQPGDKKCYQYWYRDPGGSPCGSNFNLSNAVTVTWM